LDFVEGGMHSLSKRRMMDSWIGRGRGMSRGIRGEEGVLRKAHLYSLRRSK